MRSDLSSGGNNSVVGPKSEIGPRDILARAQRLQPIVVPSRQAESYQCQASIHKMPWVCSTCPPISMTRLLPTLPQNAAQEHSAPPADIHCAPRPPSRHKVLCRRSTPTLWQNGPSLHISTFPANPRPCFTLPQDNIAPTPIPAQPPLHAPSPKPSFRSVVTLRASSMSTSLRR